MLGGSTTATQILTYTGIQVMAFTISADLTVSKTGSANVCEAQISVNGAPLTETTVTFNVVATHSFTRVEKSVVVLNPGATVQVRLSNTEGTQAVVVRSVALSARRIR